MAQDGREEKGGLRERKKAETRAAIERATIELSLERGFNGTTIDDICERAGISRMTFFNYFSSKSSALLGRPPVDFDEADVDRELEERAGKAGENYLDVLVDLATRRREPLPDQEVQEMRLRAFEQDPTLLVYAQKDYSEDSRRLGMRLGTFLSSHPEARLFKDEPIKREVVFAVSAVTFLMHVRFSMFCQDGSSPSAAELRHFAAEHLVREGRAADAGASEGDAACEGAGAEERAGASGGACELAGCDVALGGDASAAAASSIGASRAPEDAAGAREDASGSST